MVALPDVRAYIETNDNVGFDICNTLFLNKERFSI